jgi:hypothetical protein
MRRYPYIPFTGQLSTLNAPELARLRDISAGWYVAYEEFLPPAGELAKHLASFANLSGGWLFLGIAADESMRARSFPGLPAKEVPGALASLRLAAGTCITPEVCFEVKIVEGPAPELDLPESHSIIAVGVPEGGTPPYIHVSGAVYRRTAGSSLATPETERHALDLLWSRRIESQQRLGQFLSRTAELAEPETQPLVNARLYLLEDPFLTGNSPGLSYEDFCSTLGGNSATGLISAAFTTFFPTPDGYVAKMKNHKEPLSEVVTFRWWSEGNACVSMPIRAHFLDTFPLYSDPQRADFVRLLRSQGLEQWRVADLSRFLATVAAGIAKYLHLRSIVGSNQAFWAKTRFCQWRRVVPFINLRQYIEIIKTQGAARIEDDDFYLPPGNSPDALIKLEPARSAEPGEQALRLALRLTVGVFRALGIDFDRFAKEDPKGFLRDLANSMNASPPGR